MPAAPMIGPYEIIRKLGEGAFGWVFEVLDSDGHRFALKVLRPTLSSDSEAQERFQREMKISLGLRHERIVATYELGRFRDSNYMVSEYMSDGSLGDLLAAEKKLSIRRVIALAIDIFEALGALEERGLVHRDLKPENVLLDASGRAKLADLGLARDESAEVTALTGEGVMVGTPHYMSPEMIDGDSSIDLRSDFYSAGVMLYELLTRSKPFPAKNLEQLYDQHLYMDPAPITELRGDVPTELALLIHQLLSKTPGERPAKTDDILRLLRELSESNAGASFGDSSVLNPASLKARAESQESSAEQPRPKDTASFLLRITGPKGQTRCVFLKAGKSLSLGRLVSTGASVDLGLAVNRCNAGEETRRISRRHAEFQIDQGQVRVLDLGSTAGSFLNDQRL